jgi:rhodanese-related sulfurtransferase
MQVNTLSVAGIKEAIRNGNIVADMREADEFIEGFIPGSLFLYPGAEKSKFFKENIAELGQWVLLCPKSDKESFAEWLTSATGGKVNGWLEGGFEAWSSAGEPIDMIISIEPDEFMMDLKFSTPYIVDLRSEIAYQQLHLEGAENIQPAMLTDKAAKLPVDKTIYLYCEDGRMSLSVISALKRQGFHQFYHLRGGIKALFQAEAPMVKK